MRKKIRRRTDSGVLRAVDFKQKLPVIFTVKSQNIYADKREPAMRNGVRRPARPTHTSGENERSAMKMANSNNLVNPNAREAMDRFKMEAASEDGVSAATNTVLK